MTIHKGGTLHRYSLSVCSLATNRPQHIFLFFLLCSVVRYREGNARTLLELEDRWNDMWEEKNHHQRVQTTQDKGGSKGLAVTKSSKQAPNHYFGFFFHFIAHMCKKPVHWGRINTETLSLPCLKKPVAIVMGRDEEDVVRCLWILLPVCKVLSLTLRLRAYG